MSRRVVYTPVECPQCHAEGYLVKGGDWFRCLKCEYEGPADEVVDLD